MMIEICGTSFLLPGNPAWRALGPGWKPRFADYGQWAQTLLQAPPKLDPPAALAWVVFLADLVPDGALAAVHSDPGGLESLVSPLLDPLRARLAAQPQTPVIVAHSLPPAGPAAWGARAPAPWERLRRFWEDSLYALAAAHANLLILPLDSHLARPGLDKSLDARNFYAARCRLSQTGLAGLAQGLGALLERWKHAAKKVLALDCDNTLWGGVVGEVGLGGLVLGQDGLGKAFQDFQRAAQDLARQGVLLVLVSKNNEADVWEVFDRHPGMVLTRRDIVAHRVNWVPKAQNLLDLAADLDLGADSFVFWDDNPLERATVRAQAPQVTVAEPPEQVFAWPGLLRGLEHFARFESTAEDAKKVAQYKARAQFKSEQGRVVDEVGFLKGIELRPKMVPLDASSAPRAAQLCAKTNQFNLRLARHGQAEILEMAALPGAVGFLGHLSDRFGDHGNVALVLARPTADPQVAFLDSFMLSCRVLGRHFEAWALAQCAGGLRSLGARWLVAEFIPQARNQVAQDFLSGHGLTPLEQIEAGPRGRLEALCGPLAGRGFVADLENLIIPYLEIYE